MSWTRRLAVSTGLAVAAVGIAVPLSLSTTSASATSADPVAAAVQVQGKLPQELKSDLKAAWAAPDGQRVAALQAVLQKAVAGDYGDKVQKRATRLQKRLAAMDPALRKDLQAAIELPKEQRQAAFRDIRQKIRSGAYGEDVKRNARILKHLRHHRMFG